MLLLQKKANAERHMRRRIKDREGTTATTDTYVVRMSHQQHHRMRDCPPQKCDGNSTCCGGSALNICCHLKAGAPSPKAGIMIERANDAYEKHTRHHDHCLCQQTLPWVSQQLDRPAATSAAAANALLCNPEHADAAARWTSVQIKVHCYEHPAAAILIRSIKSTSSIVEDV